MIKFDSNIIKGSIEFKTIMLSRILSELNSRKNCLYYTYESASPHDNGGKQLEFHKCQSKIKILEGGNRSSKTTTTYQELIWIALGEHPFIHDIPVPNNGWFVTSSFRKLKETGGNWDKFNEHLPKNQIQRIINRDDNNKIIFKNGSEIQFKSQEQGVSAFTAVSLHWAVIDERMSNEDMRNQLRMRVLDTDGRMYFTMDKLEEDEWAQDLVTGGNASIWTLTVDDNKYLSEEAKERLKKDLSIIEYDRLTKGIYINKDVQLIFPQGFIDDMKKAKSYVSIVPQRFDMIEGRLYPNENGKLRIYKDRVAGEQYVISADTSEGVGIDDSVMQVFSQNGEQYAEWFDNETKPANFAIICYQLACYFNQAVICVENKNSGGTVINELLNYGANLFYDVREMDRRKIGNSYQKQSMVKEFGIRTADVNKRTMINQTRLDMEHGRLLIHSDELVCQLLRFAFHPKEGVEGKYHGVKKRGLKSDDLVMALFFVDYVLRKWYTLANYEGVERPEGLETKIVKTIDDISGRTKPNIEIYGGRSRKRFDFYSY